MNANKLYSELSKVVRAEVYKQIDQPMTWQVANAVTAGVSDVVIDKLDSMGLLRTQEGYQPKPSSTNNKKSPPKEE